MGNSYSAVLGQTAIDQFIAQGQGTTLQTIGNLEGSGIVPYQPSIGLSASICDIGGGLKTAHVIEVLGTKYFDADRVREAGGPNFYAVIGHDTAAMIANDVSAVGARPYDIRLFFANQGKAWYEDVERTSEFYRGWRNACDEMRTWFSGGETAGLHCAVVEGQAVFAGSAVGLIKPTQRVYDGTEIRVDDRLIGWRSRGMMCNGFTLVHTGLIPALPEGYSTPVPGEERTVGEALLELTDLVAPAVRLFQHHGRQVRMINNITGHGFRKIARATEPFTYVVTELPPRPAIFSLMIDTLEMSEQDAFRDYNLGLAGVVVCDPQDARGVISDMREGGLLPIDLGYVAAPSGDTARTVIEPVGIELLDE